MALLTGVLKYKDFEFGMSLAPLGVSVGILIDAPDNGDISNLEYLDFLDAEAKKEEDKAGVLNRRLDISLSGKYKTNILNKEFCSLLADVICTLSNYGHRSKSGFLFASEDGSVKALAHTAEYELSRVSWGTVSRLRFQDISRNVKFDISARDTSSISNALFPRFGNKNKYGNEVYKGRITNVAFKSEYSKPFRKEELSLGLTDASAMVYPDFATLAKYSDKDFTWLNNKKYYIVKPDEVDDVLNEFFAYDGFIGFDTETKGLVVTHESRAKGQGYLVGFSLSKEEGVGYYFPLQHKLFENVTDDVQYFITSKMKFLLESKKLMCANTSFDWKVMYGYGVILNVVWDALTVINITLRYTTSSNVPKDLKGAVSYFCGFDMVDLEDTVIGGAKRFEESGVTFADLPYDVVKAYAPADAEVLILLLHKFEKMQLLQNYATYDLLKQEIEFSKAVGYSEYYGLHSPRDRKEAIVTAVETDMEEAQKELFEIAGYKFNPRSTKELQSAMFDVVGVPMIGGSRSTKKELLTEMLHQTQEGSNTHKFVSALKAYRDAEGLYKTFVKRYEEFVSDGGFIYPRCYQFGTNTGRLSYKDPNCQSYSKKVKKNITARDGFLCFNCDFSQIEIRIMASLAKSEILIKAMSDPNMDAHRFVASMINSRHYTEVTGGERSAAKGVGFGLPYGMSGASVGLRVYGMSDPDYKSKGERLMNQYFSVFGEIRDYLEKTRDEALVKGYSETYLGRRRWYNKLTTSVGKIRRQAGNHGIQGGAADYYKSAVVRFFHAILEHGWDGLVLLNAFVHDEVEGEVHESVDFVEFTKVWRETFEYQMEGWCKVYAGFGVGTNWYDAKSMDLAPDYLDRVCSLENGFFGSGVDVIQNILDDKHEYYSNKTKRYLLDPENQGKHMSNFVALDIAQALDVSGTDLRNNFEDVMSRLCEKMEISRDSFDILPPDYSVLAGEFTAEVSSGGIGEDGETGGQEEFLTDMSEDELALSMISNWGYYHGDSEAFYMADGDLLIYAANKGYFEVGKQCPLRLFRKGSTESEPTKFSLSYDSIRDITTMAMMLNKQKSVRSRGFNARSYQL